jgi:hypothetical protein
MSTQPKTIVYLKLVQRRDKRTHGRNRTKEETFELNKEMEDRKKKIRKTDHTMRFWQNYQFCQIVLLGTQIMLYISSYLRK